MLIPGLMKPHILIVDDNPTNLKLAGDLLELEGWTVRRAVDAESALEMLRDAFPDLILMDVSLPGMDGLTLTGILKNSGETKHIIIVAQTAFAMKGDKEKIMAAGCDGYITKPIDTRKFSGQVAKYLKLQENETEKDPNY
jgi:two-component system, cell cycle response regulator DivK